MEFLHYKVSLNEASSYYKFWAHNKRFLETIEMLIYFTFLVLIVIGFIFDKNEGFSNLLLFLLLMFVIFILLLQMYYIKDESTTLNLPTGKAKSIKKKRDLEKAFDAILNKNKSSID